MRMGRVSTEQCSILPGLRGNSGRNGRTYEGRGLYPVDRNVIFAGIDALRFCGNCDKMALIKRLREMKPRQVRTGGIDSLIKPLHEMKLLII